MNDLDEWMNAGCAMLGTVFLSGTITAQPYLKPMAALLRSNKPIPCGIRDLLAELLDPGDPPLYNVKLTAKKIRTDRKEAELVSKIIVAVSEYDKLRNEGKSAIEARAGVEKKYGWNCDESSFNRRRRLVHAHQKRVRCEDITGKNFGK